MSVDYVMHVLVGGVPLCGAPDPGPVPFGNLGRVICCEACMAEPAGGMRREMTMRYHLEKVRAALAAKCRTMSAQEQEDFASSISSAAMASMIDAEASPLQFDEGRLMAALYAICSLRAGLMQVTRAGLSISPRTFSATCEEMEMVLVALAEGVPD